ncbi:hypothetical protein [Pseudophaeobacter sp.]|uniref:hypothetical protein n=1 Tax=Pseudophaeobacter sp. TaxID=1971739 RepID=UPI0026091759|nr:hypothetical protein [Pseudophaeobacter sp.]
MIADFLRQEKNNGTPFSFLIGAGCSRSAGIPLASELVDEINTSGRFDANISRLSEEQRSDYGQVMAVLDIKERQSLLGTYLQQAKVNWGHVALASMMKSGFISRALTFNFDNVLARACGLCSIYPATYDFVSGVTDKLGHIATPSIIHLHGQGHGLALLNSKRETEQHAFKLRPLLNDTLQRSSMLVIGYSGASDEVFPVLKDVAITGNRLFWIAYDSIPEPHVAELLEAKHELGEFFGGVDSDAFLIELANNLQCFPPPIIATPISHAKSEIAEIAEFPLRHTHGSYTVDLMAAVREFLDEVDAKISDEDFLGVQTTLKLIHSTVTEDDATNQRLSDQLRAAIYFELGKNTHRIADDLSNQDENESIANFRKAANYFEQSTKLAPDFRNAWNNLGVSRYEIAELTKQEDDYAAAISTYTDVTDRFPGYASSIQNCGSAYLGLALVTDNKAHYDCAYDHYRRAKEITPNQTYDFACFFAVTKDFVKAKENLEISVKAGTSPPTEYMRNDPDLAGLAQFEWFEDLIELAPVGDD